MIIVDTNVVSEPLRPDPDRHVLDWLNRQQAGTLYLTATVLSELMTGIERLPEGRRKAGFRKDIDKLIESIFEDRILPFDADAARQFAITITSAAGAGKAIHIADGQIAAVALCRGFSVATRDVAAFKTAGVEVINPWAQR